MFKRMMAGIAIGLTAMVMMAGVAGAQAQAGDDPLIKIAKYEFGQSRAPLMQIEAMARQPEQKAKIEAAMIEVLKDKQATYAGKEFACRMLKLVGTEQSVPALAALLGNKRQSHMARWALQMMPYPAVDEALAAALQSTTGDTRIGVITTIGARKDTKAVDALAKLAAEKDKTTASAAIAALGTIGGAEAEKALAGLKGSDKAMAAEVADKRLLAADQMLAAGQKDAAEAVYKNFSGEGNPVLIRIAALRGIVRTGKERALATEMDALKGKNARLAAAACQFFNEIPGEAATKALCEALPGLPAPIQVMALTALTGRGDKSAAEAAAKMLASGDEAVKVAATKAVAALGGGAQVKPLVELAAAGGESAGAAAEALALIHAEGAGAAVIEAAGTGEPKMRVKAIEAIEARHDASAVPALLTAAQDADRQVKTAAAKALGSVAGEKDLPAMTEMLVKSKSEGERSALEKALVSVALRVKNKDGAAETVVTSLNGADDAVKGNLMVVLAALDSQKSLDALTAQVKSDNVALKKAAIRALATWPNQKPAPVLLDVAKGDADAVCKVLALRGYVDVVGRAQDVKGAEQVKMLSEAWGLAQQTEDKNMIIKGVANVTDKAALEMIEPLLSQSDVAMAAQFAYLKVAKAIQDRQVSIAALQKLVSVSTSESVKKQAEEALGKLGAKAKPQSSVAKPARRGGQRTAQRAQRQAQRQARQARRQQNPAVQ